jgi:HAD superfamily hydrolase (TIGR01509 family)
MTKAILWDNDGVLVDTERFYFDATRQVMRSIGIDLTPELYRALFLLEGKGAWHLAEERGVDPDQILKLKLERDRLYTGAVRENGVVIDGVEEVLAALHGKYVMGIVTSAQKSHFHLIHESTGLLRYIDFVVTAGGYTRFKPDAEPYSLAVEKSGCGRDDCVAIEDSARGLASAVAAGVRCLVIPTELTRGSGFAGAAGVLNTVRDVPRSL